MIFLDMKSGSAAQLSQGRILLYQRDTPQSDQEDTPPSNTGGEMEMSVSKV